MPMSKRNMALKLHEERFSVRDIAAQLGISKSAVQRYLNPPVRKTGSRKGDEPWKMLDTKEDEIPLIEDQNSIDFLRSVINNHKVPYNNRIQAAIAVARIESGLEDKEWTPPQDDNLWGEALGDALKVQSPQVIEQVLGRMLDELKGSESPETSPSEDASV